MKKMINGMEMTSTNNTYTTDSSTRMKSRYCVKCQALYSFQCSCPNHVRHKNVMKDFHKVSMVSVKKSLEEVGLNEAI